MKATIQDVKTETIRQALLEIAADNGGALSPQTIVEVARNPSSVLHEEFEWDDGIAADAYRLAQAGMLVRRVKLTVIRKDESQQVIKLQVRQFESRPSQRGERGYETVEDIMKDPAKREEMLQQVLNELAAFRRRYENLNELQEIWSAIDRLSSPPKKTKRA